MGNLVVKTQMPQAKAVVHRLGLDEGGAIQEAVTSEVFTRIKNYMPRKSGALIASMQRVGKTLIKVDTPYARAQFFGVTSKGLPFDYNTGQNPQAGSHWDRRLAAAEGRAIAAKVERIARKVGGRNG